ncbi:uncharacterized protein V1510DRAFT_420460 [Dipodascopsis tothii]|uniref:uncharacterized protein n=1 Tax=Dipodascopsis tothii TaxID=44089 RepID=UPI0034CD4DEE
MGPRARPYRWHSMLVGASGLGAAMSDESLKSLRYCLQCLKLANTHLGRTIERLQELIELRKETAVGAERTSVSELKAEIVATIRKVVTVVSTYAGAALPEPARSHVRGYLLRLPSRWAAASSQMDAPRHRRTMSASSTGSVGSTATGATDATDDPEHATRILLFATESLDMLRGVMNIVDDTLDRAEVWCDRFGRRRPGDEPVVKLEGASPGSLDAPAASPAASDAATPRVDSDGDTAMA